MTIRQMTDEELRYEGVIAARKYRRQIRERKEAKRKEIISNVIMFFVMIALMLSATVYTFEMRFDFNRPEVISAEMAD